MPVIFIEAPPGIRVEAKQKLMEKITSAIDEAHHIGDTLIFLREYPAENVGWTAACSPKIRRSLRPLRR